MDAHTPQQGRTEQSIYGVGCGCAYRVRGCGGAGGLEASKCQHDPTKVRLECSTNRSNGTCLQEKHQLGKHSLPRRERDLQVLMPKDSATGGRGRSVGIDMVSNAGLTC